MCSVTVSYASPVRFEELGFILSFVWCGRLKRKWSFSEFPILVLSYGDPRRVWLYPAHLDLEAVEYSGREQELGTKTRCLQLLFLHLCGLGHITYLSDLQFLCV